MPESNGKRYHVYLGQPNAGSIMPCALRGIAAATKRHKMTLVDSQFGDIPHNFNMLWCGCVQNREEHGYTHFAMVHSDINPQPHWLDTLIEEMDRVNADVISTVVAIKDARGLTTTGIRYPGVWGTRRYTLKEIHDLPETFSIADTDEPDQILAINTGLWVCRVGYGWPDKFPGFQNEHRITWRRGVAQPEFDSEDWLFSDWLASQGLRVFATRKVAAWHAGGFEYGNDSVWGSLETDNQAPRRRAEEETCVAAGA